MHNLTASTSLGGANPASETIGQMTVSEVPFTALASVSARLGGEEHTTQILKTFSECDAPGPNKMSSSSDINCFWTGQDQWMISAPMESHELMASDLDKLAAGKASVTEQSGGWVQFDVSGSDLNDMFERLCALPIRHMGKGDANRTRIEQIGCFVLHHGDRISVLGPRSSAGSLYHALLTCAKSIA
ncbi:MAG: sarcosine oxidase subunit gamma [Paracoccaceae bacterium]|nr:sarcosine oxidase subunit gamma [Paracoccaceae bacterium]MDG1737882.1 sarcosine oxidase subunit gamma [Paracoccaceae bacterium]MDG2259069.1 sarcosine oxidase subunit gamma [Paracoccaceae bacterium]